MLENQTSKLWKPFTATTNQQFIAMGLLLLSYILVVSLRSGSDNKFEHNK